MSSRAVREIADEVDREDSTVVDDPNLVEVSSGIVFRIKPVPYKLILKLEKKFRLPKVPIYYDDNKGREIPNYADPSYEEECRLVQEEKGVAMLELLTGLGTELVYLPEGVYGPEDEGWVDEVAPFLDEGEVIPDTGKARYVAWVDYYALQEATDIALVAQKIQRKMGVTEAGVASAMRGFPGNEERDTDRGASTQE